MSGFAYEPRDADDVHLVEHDDAWHEFEEEEDQVFMGSARNYLYKGQGRRISRRPLVVFAALDQDQLSSHTFEEKRNDQTRLLPQLDDRLELPESIRGGSQFPADTAAASGFIGQNAPGVGYNPISDPLPSGDFTRFIEILPGSHRPLRCRLHTARVPDCAFKYEAISLQVGNDSALESEQILCNQTEIRCHRNLYQALEKLRKLDKSRLVWAASLCIDLNNVHERNQHAQLCASIFKSAHRVLVFLKMDMNHDPNLMFAGICKVVNTWRRQSALEDRIEKADFTIFDAPSMHKMKPVPKPCLLTASAAWLPAIQLFENGWFGSTWSIQEVSVARSAMIIAGKNLISFEWIGLAAGILRENYGRLPGGWHPDWTPGKRPVVSPGILCAYFMYRISLSQQIFDRIRPTFRQLLSLSQGFQCKFEHDRIYGLFGAPTIDGISSHLIPDYAQPVAKVNYDVACLILRASKSLDLLADIHQNHDMQGQMLGGQGLPVKNLVLQGPSWVPQWRDEAAEAILPLQSCPEFSTGNYAQTNIQISPDGSILAARGTIIDAVTGGRDACFDHFWRGRDEGGGQFWPSGQKSRSEVSPPDTTNITMRDLEAMAMTVTGGKDWVGLPVSDVSKHVADYARCLLRGGLRWSLNWIREIKGRQQVDRTGEITPETLGSLSVGGNADRILDAAATFYFRRAQFVTARKIWGIAPDATQHGDLLCVFNGVGVPYMMRPRPDGHLFVVGECYVYDMMRRESMEETMARPGAKLAETWLKLL